MAIRRTAIWLLAAGIVLWSADRAAAQPAHSNLHYQVPHPTYERGPAPFSNDVPGPERLINPFHPVGFEPQFDWFAPAETSGYGRGPRPHIGYFFSYERVFWSLSKSETALVGSPTAAPPETDSFIGDIFGGFPAVNTVDTGKLLANGAWGNRWELGYIDTDDYGWFVSVLDHVSQSQYHRDQFVRVQFNDPSDLLFGTVIIDNILFGVGKMETVFEEAMLQNIARLNGVEVNRFYRARQLHSGAYFEVLYGVRWLQLQDMFIFIGENTSGNFLNPLQNSFWRIRTQNNLVGPEIGMRLFRQRGRWVTSLEARFLAAANFQNAQMRTVLGDEIGAILNEFDATEGVVLPRAFTGLGSNKHDFYTTFSPVGELKVNVSWQATRNVGLKVGYTGMVIGNVTRASNRFRYDEDDLVTLRDGKYHQLFFVNGINFGVEINR
jgi:hypothetical protein